MSDSDSYESDDDSVRRTRRRKSPSPPRRRRREKSAVSTQSTSTLREQVAQQGKEIERLSTLVASVRRLFKTIECNSHMHSFRRRLARRRRHGRRVRLLPHATTLTICARKSRRLRPASAALHSHRRSQRRRTPRQRCLRGSNKTCVSILVRLIALTRSRADVAVCADSVVSTSGSCSVARSVGHYAGVASRERHSGTRRHSQLGSSVVEQ